jgi:hypothetical protein
MYAIPILYVPVLMIGLSRLKRRKVIVIHHTRSKTERLTSQGKWYFLLLSTPGVM